MDDLAIHKAQLTKALGRRRQNILKNMHPARKADMLYQVYASMTKLSRDGEYEAPLLRPGMSEIEAKHKLLNIGFVGDPATTAIPFYAFLDQLIRSYEETIAVMLENYKDERDS